MTTLGIITKRLLVPPRCVPFKHCHAYNLNVMHHVVTHALYVGLVFCHGKPGGPYHILNCTHGALRARMQVRRDDFPGSHVCKCIHIMHHISISSWHRNGRIVPAFFTYHFVHCIFYKSFHHHASNMFCFAYLLFSCLLMHDPCIFLRKTKTKKRKHESSHCILSCMC